MENSNSTGYGPGQFGKVPMNKEEGHNVSPPIADGQKLSPPMGKITQGDNVKTSSFTPRS